MLAAQRSWLRMSQQAQPLFGPAPKSFFYVWVFNIPELDTLGMPNCKELYLNGVMKHGPFQCSPAVFQTAMHCSTP